MQWRLAAALVVWASGVAWAQGSTVTVAADGSGQYRTLQAAVDAAPAGHETIRLKPGTYREKVRITAPDVVLLGLGAKPEDVVLSWDDSAARAGGTGKSGTLTVTGEGFQAENLTIENNFEALHGRSEEGSQAVALYNTADRSVLRHVRLLGYQDTLYAASSTCHPAAGGMNADAATLAAAAPCRASRQLYADSYIAGHVDFIFGDAKAVFLRDTLHGVAHATVMLTAQSRLYPAEDSGYLFDRCTVMGDAGIGQLVLGRPWRAYATVIFKNTRFEIAPDSQGWSEWAGKLKTATYAGYALTGPDGKPLDTSQWLTPSRMLTPTEAAQDTPASWLAGADGWKPKL